MGRSGWVRAALAALLLATAAPAASAQPAGRVQPSAQGCPVAVDQIVTASVASEWAAGMDARGKPGSEVLKAVLNARGGR